MELVLIIGFVLFIVFPPAYILVAGSRLIFRPPEQEERKIEKTYALARASGLARLISVGALIGLVYRLGTDVVPCSFRLVFLLPLLLLGYVVNTLIWGLCYRKIKGAKFSLIGYLGFRVAWDITYRGFGVWVVCCMLLQWSFPAHGWIGGLNSILPLGAVVVALSFLLPVALGRLPCAVAPLPHEYLGLEPPGRLARIRRVSVLRTHGVPYAQAAAFPVMRHVVLTDFLLQNLAENETKSVLLHEAGHLCSRREAVYRFVLVAASAILLMSILPYLERVSFPLKYTPFVLYVALRFLSSRIAGKLELAADAFAWRDPDVGKEFPEALRKIYQLNWIPLAFRVGKDGARSATLECRLKALGQDLVLTDTEKQLLQEMRAARKKAPVRLASRMAIVVVIVAVVCGVLFVYRTYRHRHTDAGIVLFNQGSYEAALAEFRKKVEQYPDDAPAHYNVATALGRLGRWQEAMDELETTLRLDPSHDEAARYLDDIKRYLDNGGW